MESFIRQPTRGKRLSRAKTFTWLSGAHVGDWLWVVCRWKCVVFVVYSLSRDDFCQRPQSRPLKVPFHGRTDRRASRDEMPRRVTNEYADTCYSYSCRGYAFVPLQIFPGPTHISLAPLKLADKYIRRWWHTGWLLGQPKINLEFFIWVILMFFTPCNFGEVGWFGFAPQTVVKKQRPVVGWEVIAFAILLLQSLS